MPFPSDIVYVFRASALGYITPYLDMVFKDENVIKKAWEYKKIHCPQESDTEFFLWYFEHKLNPLINSRLNRDHNHPTMENILRLAFREELKRTKHLNRNLKSRIGGNTNF